MKTLYLLRKNQLDALGLRIFPFPVNAVSVRAGGPIDAIYLQHCIIERSRAKHKVQRVSTRMSLCNSESERSIFRQLKAPLPSSSRIKMEAIINHP